jgi:hypothetical protein
MIFKLRRSKSKWCKEWYDASKQYRITCVKCVDGIKITPHYHALVKLTLPKRTMWDFADRRGPYKTRRKAIEACERHQKLWEKALEAKTKTELFAILGQLPVGIPEWVHGSLSPQFRQLLMRNAE